MQNNNNVADFVVNKGGDFSLHLLHLLNVVWMHPLDLFMDLTAQSSVVKMIFYLLTAFLSLNEQLNDGCRDAVIKSEFMSKVHRIFFKQRKIINGFLKSGK